MIISVVIPLFTLLISLVGISVILHEAIMVETYFIKAVQLNILEKSIRASFAGRLNEVPETRYCKNPNNGEYLKYEHGNHILIVYLCKPTQNLMYKVKPL